ncbi:MAG: acyl--CoA ligase [Burkholderiaceae bacterium]|nr:acyl--CoA ligase [Burkholderiaceae bacterium]
MRIGEDLAIVADSRPQKTALVVGERRLGYVALLAAVQALARRLRDAGAAAGERVVVCIADPALYAVALHAVLASGATFVPLPATARAPRIAFALRDVRARLLLSEPALRPVWSEAVANTGLDKPGPKGWSDGSANPRLWPAGIDELSFAACVLRPPASPHDLAAPPADLACILYTSGTTGVPKGAMLTHAGMRSAWDMVQAYLQLCGDDIIALPLAPTFSYGLYHVLMGLGLGATIVAEPAAQAFPRVLLQRLVAERATVLPGVPMLFAGLLGHLGGAGGGDFDLAALRTVTNAAAALPPAHLERLAALLPRARVLSMYGMTECKRISWLPPEEITRRPASVGRGLAGQQHWLVDEAGRRLAPGSEAAGELVVRGPHLMAGYWERPAETAERLMPDGDDGASGPCLHTGDLFRADADGFLHFVARRDDIIKSRGEKVAPREVESVICTLAGVREAAVVGVPDAMLGQAVVAYVVPEAGAVLEARQVIRHCLAGLEPHMAPKEVQFVRELPRTDSGKLRRADLAAGRAQDNAA